MAAVSGAGTYGGSGVGNGAKIVLLDSVEEWAEATKATIEEQGGEAITATADVTNPQECQQAIDLAMASFGGLHILHNNVGGGARVSVAPVS